jgi:tetratricopeptide (TPR) repeat protein
MSQQETIHRHYTLAELTELVGVPRGRIRSWIRAGLVQPPAKERGEVRFNFQQITAVTTLAKLTQAGVKVSRLRRCLDQLRAWFPDVEDPLARLALLEQETGHVLIRLEDGQLAEPTGQQHFDFDGDAKTQKPTAPCIRSEPWRQRAHYLEDAGELEAAELAYRQALLEDGPDPGLCFNLGNVLFGLGRKEQAVERYRQAVEVDNNYPEAWNNLGSALEELNHLQEAIDAYRRAITLNLGYADPYHNLADLLDQIGQRKEAQPMWQSYLRLEPTGPWADYAKQRLATISTRSENLLHRS